MKRSKYTFALLALILGYALVGTAIAPMLTFTYKDVKAKGAVETDTYGINDSGAIAGDFVDSSAVQHLMILKGTKLTKLDDKNCSTTPGAAGPAFYGINSAGTAVGWCTSATSGEPIGLMYAKGKLTEFTVPKALETEGTGINDKGDIVGAFFDTAGAEHGFLLHAKKYTQLDAPKDSSTVAWDINNKGQITVYATNSSGFLDAFLLTGKTYKNIDVPTAEDTYAHSLNNKGDIDGTYIDSTGTEKGWLLHGGKYYDVVDPGGVTRADGLNDKITIVGRYGSGTYGGTGFEATTKP